MLAMVLIVGSSFACNRSHKPIDPFQLIPNSAQFVGGVEVEKLYSSSAYAAHRQQLEHAEYREFLKANDACKIDPRKFGKMVVGTDALGNFVVVVLGRDVGKPEKINCLAKKFSPDSNLVIREKDGLRWLEINSIGIRGRLFLVNHNSLVYVADDWSKEVEMLIKKKGVVYEESANAPWRSLVQRASSDHTIWFAGFVPSIIPKEGPTAGLTEISGGLDFQTGLRAKLSGKFGSEQIAQERARQARETFRRVKGMAALFGFSQSVVDSVKIVPNGSSVDVQVEASQEDLKAMQRTLSNISGGALKAPPIPGSGGSGQPPMSSGSNSGSSTGTNP